MADVTPQQLLDAAARRKKRLADYEAAFGTEPLPVTPERYVGDPTAPAAVPENYETLRELEDAVRRRAEMQQGISPETTGAAYQAIEDKGLGAPPLPHAPTKTWSQQIADSFGMQVTRDDGRELSPADRLKALGAAAIDAQPALRALEALQPLQTATAGWRDLPTGGEMGAEKLVRGVKRGVGKTIDAFTPDTTTGELLTGARAKGGFETLGEMGEGLQQVGEELLVEGDKGGLAAVPQSLAGAGLSMAGGALRGPDVVAKKFNPPIRREEEPGIRIENAMGAFLRIAGGTAEAVALEGGKRLPAPVFGTKASADALGLREDLRPPLDEDAGLLEKLSFYLEPVTVGEAYGSPSGSLQQIPRDEPSTWFDQWVPAVGRNTFQAVLERVEKGQGAEEEGLQIGTQLGFPRTGFAVGALASVMMEPEAAVAGMGSKALKVVDRFRAAGDLTKAGKLERMVSALRNPTVDVGETAGRQFTTKMEGGEAKLADLPEKVRAHLDDILAEQNIAAEELAAIEGLEAMPDMVSKSGEARRLDPEVIEARKGAEGPVDAVEELDPNRAAPGNLYVVRNALEGEAAVTRSLEEAVDVMEQRGIEGDTVWRSGIVPIAAWERQSSGVTDLALAGSVDRTGLSEGPKKFVLRRLKGAEGHDAAVIERRAKKDGEVVRTLRSLFEPEQRSAGRVYSDMDAGVRSSPAEPTTRLGRAIEDAYRRTARDLTGTSELTYLPTGAKVTHADKAAIMRSVERDLAAAGLSSKGRANPTVVQRLRGKGGADADGLAPDAKFVRDGELPDGAQEKLDALAKRYGLAGFDPTPSGLRDLRVAAVKYHGGALASARSAVRGLPGFWDRATELVASWHNDRRTWLQARGSLRTTQDRLVEAFADVAAGVPERVEGILRRTQSRLERVADDMLGEQEAAFSEFRGKNGIGWSATLTEGQVAQVYARFMDDVRPVDVEQARIVDRVLDPGAGRMKADEARRLRDELAPELPAWATETDDPKLMRAAVKQWAKKAQRDMAAMGRDYLAGVLATGGVNVRGSALVEGWWKNIPEESLVQVYKGVFLGGSKSTLASLAREQGVKKYSAAQAMQAFLVNQRRRVIVDEAMDELVQAGAAVQEDELFVRSSQQGDDRSHLLTKALLGEHVSVLADGTRVYHAPPGAIAWAERTLRAMGLRKGQGPDAIARVVLSDVRRFDVPRYLEQRIVQALTAGKVKPDVQAALGDGASTMGNALSASEAYRLWKMHTTGLNFGVIPRPSYALGQSIGQFFTLWTTRGLVDAVRTAPAIAGAALPKVMNPSLVSEMMMRLGEPDVPLHDAPNPLGQVVRDVNGTLWDVDELVKVARDHGLADTIVSFETSAHLERLLLREMTRPGRLLWGPAVWQKMVLNYFGGFDQAARLSTFLDEVQRGTPPARAAKEAKRASLDFRDLSQFEAQWLRMGFTFYAYQRKSADTLLHAWLRHPERIGQQMRLARILWTEPRSGPQAGTIEGQPEQDMARIWFDMEHEEAPIDAKGNIDLRHSWSPTSPPVMLPEAIRNLRMFMATPALGVDDEWGGAVNPFLDSLAIEVAGRRVGRTYDSDVSNVIPPIIADFPGGGDLIMEALGAGPKTCAELGLNPGDAAPSASAANLGRPSVWVAGAGVGADLKTSRNRWQQLQLYLSSAPANLTGLARTTGLAEPRFGLTWEDEALWAVGVTWKRSATTEEAVNDQQLDLDRRRREEIKAARPEE